MSSCSADDNEKVIPKLLVSETSSLIGQNTFDYERHYTYDDAYNLIAEDYVETNNIYNRNSEYIFENERIVGANIFDEGNNMIGYNIIEYNGDNIKKIVTAYGNAFHKEYLYTYNSDNIIMTREIKDIIDNTIEIYDYEYNATENTLKITERMNLNNYRIYTYDNKKSPFTNNSFMLKSASSIGFILNNHNLVKREFYENGIITRTNNYLNEYDAEDFLTKITRTSISNSGTTQTIITYTYNQ
ncbi:MAG: hypothetical protein L3J14_09295 [Flavobacteriaceae bacterium]|nr:hypothetical protein [Flavobacteriaceae bacterium]